MRVIVQRVKRAAVQVGGQSVAAIGPGMLLYAAFRPDDDAADIAWMADKVVSLRIFADPADKMNLSALDVGGQILVVSQFTLYGDARKGRRPASTAPRRLIWRAISSKDSWTDFGRPASQSTWADSRNTWRWSRSTTVRSRFPWIRRRVKLGGKRTRESSRP